ncbi:MAG: glycosyltransferase family 4 protein [Salibacteraceae bacterium]
MRVALMTDGIQPYVTGGMQKHSFYVAKFLAAAGIEVDLYHYNANPQFDIDALEVFTPQERANIHSMVFEFPPPGKLPGHYIRRSLRYSQQLYKAFKKRPTVDFVYIKGFAGWQFLKEKAKGRSLPPSGIKFHGMNMFQTPPSFRGSLEYAMLRPPVRFNMKHADYVFSYGGKITDIIAGTGVERSRIVELPTGIEKQWVAGNIRFTEGQRKFLYVGRYERLKGIEEINQAIKKLEKEFDFEYHFVGPIPEQLHLPSEKVKYWGKITDAQQMKAVVRSCDVVTCPSYSEGLPNVILEGMSQGLAVLATNVGAINFLVNEENGWLIEQPDSNAIADAMRNAITCDAKKMDARKQASIEKISRELTWDHIANRLVTTVQSLAGK